MKKLLIVIVGLVVVLALVAFVLPSKFDVAVPSETINAKPAEIYTDVATLKNWLDWSPWNQERDKECKHSFEGPAMGVGAKWIWKGTPMPEGLGEGEMVITKASPAEGIEYELTFVGFDKTMTGALKFKEVEGGTQITWTSAGDFASGNYFKDIVPKYMMAFGVMDRNMKKEYGAGFAKLKERAEKRAGNASKAVEAAGSKK